MVQAHTNENNVGLESITEQSDEQIRLLDSLKTAVGRFELE